jgi:hypothetical protein
MSQEDKPQSSSDKEKKVVNVSERVSITEDVVAVLKRVDQLLDKAKEREKEVEILEEERKKDEEALKQIRRRYNIS